MDKFEGAYNLVNWAAINDENGQSDMTIFQVIQVQNCEEENQQHNECFTRIRIEKIEFQEAPATAVYFEDVTKIVQMMRLESQLIAAKNHERNLESTSSMMSHEFRTPLGTALMFLDLVLTIIEQAEAIRLLNLVKSSLGLLLSLVHDMLDLRLIKEN